MKFKVGDKVKVLSSAFDSVNRSGDEGIITQVTKGDKDGLDYRVLVEGRDFHGTKNIGNWHTKAEIIHVENKKD